MTRHILILDYLHAYNDQRMLLQAEALVAEGFKVRVLGTVRFGQHSFYETRSGIDFYLLPLIATYNPLLILKAFIRWLRGDPRNVIPLPEDKPRRGNLVAIAFYWLWSFRLAMAGEISSITAHEHITLPIGWAIARIRRVPLVYDEHDYVGAIAYYEGFQGRIAAAVETFFLRRIDAATTVGERLAAVLKNYGAQRVVVIGNWKRLEDYAIPQNSVTASRIAMNLDQAHLVVSYLSIFGPSRYIPELLESIRNTPEVILLIGGSGWASYEQLIQEAATTTPNIRFLGWVDRSQIPLYTCLSDVIYHCLDATGNPQMVYATPNKLFEAFAAGKPMLAKRGTGEMSDILQYEEAGLLLDEVTAKSLREAFQQLMDVEFRHQLAVNAQHAANRYNWDEIRRRLATLYKEILPNE